MTVFVFKGTCFGLDIDVRLFKNHSHYQAGKRHSVQNIMFHVGFLTLSDLYNMCNKGLRFVIIYLCTLFRGPLNV
jgi:hypothetical protein